MRLYRAFCWLAIALLGCAGAGATGSTDPDVLARALAAGLTGNPDWRQGDMTDFALDRTFALVTIPFNAFQHLLHTDEALACLAAVRRHLAPGGLLAFDVLNPDPDTLADNGEFYLANRARAQGDGTALEVWEALLYDRATQIVDVTLVVREVSSAGELQRERRLVERLRMLFPRELELLLRLAGWRMLSRHGDFDGGPFVSDSYRQVVTCVPA